MRKKNQMRKLKARQSQVLYTSCFLYAMHCTLGTLFLPLVPHIIPCVAPVLGSLNSIIGGGDPSLRTDAKHGAKRSCHVTRRLDGRVYVVAKKVMSIGSPHATHTL